MAPGQSEAELLASKGEIQSILCWLQFNYGAFFKLCLFCLCSLEIFGIGVQLMKNFKSFDFFFLDPYILAHNHCSETTFSY